MSVIQPEFDPEQQKFVEKYKGKIVVVKIGGALVDNEDYLSGVLNQLIELKKRGVHPVLIHGGGNQIDMELQSRGLDPKKVNGSRETDLPKMGVVFDVLEKLNAKIAKKIQELSGSRYSGKGAAGYTDATILARRANDNPANYTGKPTTVNAEYFREMAADPGAIPVLSPVCRHEDMKGADATDENGRPVYKNSLNVNTDDVAVALAHEVGAAKLLFLLDGIEGVLDKNGELIKEIDVDDVNELIGDETITGGMIPKVGAMAAYTRKNGSGSCAYVNGRKSGAIVKELFSEGGSGTLFVQKETQATSNAPSPLDAAQPPGLVVV